MKPGTPDPYRTPSEVGSESLPGSKGRWKAILLLVAAGAVLVFGFATYRVQKLRDEIKAFNMNRGPVGEYEAVVENESAAAELSVENGLEGSPAPSGE